jgi:hypothetical protein
MTTTAGDPALELEYPKAFAEAFILTMVNGRKRFRYLHVSGAMVERDQNRVLWLKSSVRKIKVCNLPYALKGLILAMQPTRTKKADFSAGSR